MGMTIVEKILAKAADRESVSVGDVIEPKVDLAMSHENAALIINRFKTIYEGTGLEANVWDTSRIAIIFDHRVPAVDRKTATDQGTIRKFVNSYSKTYRNIKILIFIYMLFNLISNCL